MNSPNWSKRSLWPLLEILDMHICSHRHDEIVHNERSCPLCAVIADKEDAEGKIKELEDKVNSLEEQIREDGENA